jgi:hypothetical protein
MRVVQPKSDHRAERVTSPAPGCQSRGPGDREPAEAVAGQAGRVVLARDRSSGGRGAPGRVTGLSWMGGSWPVADTVSSLAKFLRHLLVKRFMPIPYFSTVISSVDPAPLAAGRHRPSSTKSTVCTLRLIQEEFPRLHTFRPAVLPGEALRSPKFLRSDEPHGVRPSYIFPTRLKALEVHHSY